MTRHALYYLIAGASAALGIVVGAFCRADAGDLLSFSGALFGSAITVIGAGWVAQHLATMDRDEAYRTVREVIEHVSVWAVQLDKSVSGGMMNDDPYINDAWIDRMLITTPRMVRMFADERLIPRMANSRRMGATMRFIADLEQILPELDEEMARRRRYKSDNTLPYLPIVQVSSKSLQTMCNSAKRALAEMDGKVVRIPSP